MAYENLLESGTIQYACKFCGYTSFDKRRVEICEAHGVREKSKYKVGDVVELFYATGGKRSKFTLRWQIIRVLYSKPNETIHEIRVPFHTLYVILKPKSRVSTDLHFAFHHMLYQDLLRWQKGDLEELFNAGFIHEPAIHPSAFRLFFERIAELLKQAYHYLKNRIKRIFS